MIADSVNVRIISKAMADPDTWVIQMIYKDRCGQKTKRTVSPIRFIDDHNFTAICLSREEPRTFALGSCSEIILVHSEDVLMPMPIEIVVDCCAEET